MFQNIGSSVYFNLPSDRKSRVQGLSVCTVYEHTYAPTRYVSYSDFHTVISNKTKGLIWSHSPVVFGVGEVGEDMMCLSYWKFGNQLEGGDELNISVFGGAYATVKEVGVRLVYKEEEEEETRDSLPILPLSDAWSYPGSSIRREQFHNAYRVPKSRYRV